MNDVSVITAAYNSASEIERNIRSVAAQSLRPREHIIVDDGSGDETAAAVRRLGEEFPHVHLIRQHNSGAGQARNAGIEAASGRFIAFLDSDDTWSADKLANQVAFMLENQVVFSYGDYREVDAATGRILGRQVAPEQVDYATLLKGCPIGCLTVAFDQHALGKRYMPDVRRGQDWGLWLSLTRDGAVGRRYPGCHALYQRTGDSLSSAKLGKAANIYRIYRDQEGFGPVRSLCYLVPHALSKLARRPA